MYGNEKELLELRTQLMTQIKKSKRLMAVVRVIEIWIGVSVFAHAFDLLVSIIRLKISDVMIHGISTIVCVGIIIFVHKMIYVTYEKKYKMAQEKLLNL